MPLWSTQNIPPRIWDSSGIHRLNLVVVPMCPEFNNPGRIDKVIVINVGAIAVRNVPIIIVVGRKDVYTIPNSGIVYRSKLREIHL